MMLILKENKLKKFIQKRVDSIKINNLENRLFLEEDLIREVGKEKSNFKEKKFGVFSNIYYSILSFLGLVKMERVFKLVDYYYNKNVEKVLINSKQIKEFKRILEVSKNNKIKIQDLIKLKNDQIILAFMFDQGKFDINIILNMVDILNNNNALDEKESSKREKKESIELLKRIINEKK